MTTPLRVVFLGTPDFAVPTLKAMAMRPDVAEILCVYTQPDRPAGRGHKIAKTAVKVAAEGLAIKVLQPENINTPEEMRIFADHMADVAVVVAYAQFLGSGILNTPRLGCVNVHSSLLPKFRGAAPIQYAIWKGEKESGVTTMRLIKKMDAGPILLQKKTGITPDMTASELHDKLAEIGAELLIETLEKMQRNEITEVAQESAHVSFAPAIKKEQGRIQWQDSGQEIMRQIRALNPWPGTFRKTNRGLLKIHRVRFHGNAQGTPPSAKPGDTFTEMGGLWVCCGDGWIELLTVQPEGKAAMSAQDYMNGLKNVGKLEWEE